MLEARDVVLYLDILNNHDWQTIYEKLKRKDLSDLEQENIDLIVDAEILALVHDGYKILVISDSDYPKKILASKRPPFVIYYKCKLEEVENKFDYLHIGSPHRMFID